MLQKYDKYLWLKPDFWHYRYQIIIQNIENNRKNSVITFIKAVFSLNLYEKHQLKCSEQR